MPRKNATFCRWVLLAGLLPILSACSLFGSRVDKVDASDTQLQLGVRYMNMDKLAIAKTHLEKAIDFNAKNVEAHNALAYLHERLNEMDAALDLYEDALNLEPENLSVLNNIGRFLCERGEHRKGMAYLEQVVNSPLNNRQWLAATNAGRCALAQKQLPLAEAYLRQALQRNPSYAPALQSMQKLSYQKGEYWAAKGFYERYSGVSQQTAEALWYAYQTERALGNQEAAEHYKNKLMESFPLAEETKRIYSAQDKLKHGK